MVSIIVPCYNEEETIKLFYHELSRIMTKMNTYDFEVLFINDGSKDNTLTILKEICKNDSRVKYISFSRNFGKEAAMYAGFSNVSGEYIAVMDSDMQDPPYLLPQMISILEKNDYDSVATRRKTRTGEPPIRSFFAKMFYKIINRISDAEIEDGARDFRLMKKNMVDAIVSMNEYNRFSKGIFGWIGFKTYWLSYDNVERIAGQTKWNFWKLFKYSVDGIVNFSQTPLALASWMGLGVTLLSIFLLIFIITRKIILGDPVQGWASLVCLITFLGGIQLFCMGIIGQYLAKAYMEIKKRPHYIISDSNKEDIKLIG